MSAIKRFNAFFEGIPLWGGQEWETLGIEEIVAIFREAATEMHKQSKEQYYTAILEHDDRWWIVRWWKELRGWKLPHVHSEVEIIQAMAKRCRRLSEWMTANASRPFYAGSDMSYLIEKPVEVAIALTGE